MKVKIRSPFVIAAMLCFAALSSAQSGIIQRIKIDHADPALIYALLNGKSIHAPELSTVYNNQFGGFGGSNSSNGFGGSGRSNNGSGGHGNNSSH